MNSTNEIVDEVRTAREAYAAQFNYNLLPMYQDLEAKERVRARNLASLQPVEPPPETAVSK